MIIRMVSALALIAATMAGGVATAPWAQAARSCNYLEFVKDTSAAHPNVQSDLKFRYATTSGYCASTSYVRAGSGTTVDTCDVGDGWLPNGWYDLNTHDNHWPGSAIHGRVWYFQDKACAGGTIRTELMIHTEETVSNGQVCPAGIADSPECWDDTPAFASAANGTNDYKSNGCIKVRRESPEGNWNGDVGTVHTDWWHHYLSLAHGSSRADSLYVHA